MGKCQGAGVIWGDPPTKGKCQGAGGWGEFGGTHRNDEGGSGGLVSR